MRGPASRAPVGQGSAARGASLVDPRGLSCRYQTAEPMTTATSRALVLIFAIAGLAAAGTSTYVHYRLLTVPNFTSFCDVNSTVSCTQAYLSAYGELGGVPVAIFGALYFAAVLALAALAWRPAPAPPYAPVYIFALSVPALAFVAYLAFAAFFILNAFCILCAITYVAVIGITIVSWRASRVPFGPGPASRDAAAAIRNPLALAGRGVLVVATVFAAKAFPAGGAPAVPAPASRRCRWWPRPIAPSWRNGGRSSRRSIWGSTAAAPRSWW